MLRQVATLPSLSNIRFWHTTASWSPSQAGKGGFPRPLLQMGELTNHFEPTLHWCKGAVVSNIQSDSASSSDSGEICVKAVNIMYTKTTSRFRWKIIQITVLPWQWWIFTESVPFRFLAVSWILSRSYTYLYQNFSRKTEVISDMSKTSEWWPQLWTCYCGAGHVQLRTVESTSQRRTLCKLFPCKSLLFPKIINQHKWKEIINFTLPTPKNSRRAKQFSQIHFIEYLCSGDFSCMLFSRPRAFL